MGMADNPPKEPKVEWQGSYSGMSVYTDESLPKGTVEFRDGQGRVVGTITGIDQLRIGEARS